VGVAVGAAVGFVVGIGFVSPGVTVVEGAEVSDVSKVPVVSGTSDGSEEPEGETVVAWADEIGSVKSSETVVESSESIRGFENIVSAPRIDTNASDRSKAIPNRVRKPSPGFW